MKQILDELIIHDTSFIRLFFGNGDKKKNNENIIYKS